MARLDAHFDDSGILDLLDWFGWAITIETHSGSLTRDLFPVLRNYFATVG